MAFIHLIEDTGAEVPATNYGRAFAHRPDVFAAWRQLVGAITETMDERLYELVTLAAAPAFELLLARPRPGPAAAASSG